MKTHTKTGEKILYYSAKWAYFYLDKNIKGLHLLPTNAEVEAFIAEYNPILIDLRDPKLKMSVI